MMNKNPCGTTISIQNAATDNQASAIIVDACTTCADEDSDVSPAVFEAVGPNGLSDGLIEVYRGGSAVGGKRRLEFSAEVGCGSYLRGLEVLEGFGGGCGLDIWLFTMYILSTSFMAV